jgi:hypothetical protein
MSIRQRSQQYLTRTVLLALLVAGLAFAVVQHPGAAEKGRYSDLAYMNTVTQVQTCEAMGGTAVVVTIQTANGAFESAVSCRGGALDGFTCINSSTYGTFCSFTRSVPGHGRFTVHSGELGRAEIAPVKEPAAAPPLVVVEEIPVSAPIEQAPAVDEPDSVDATATVEPTAEPTLEVVTETPTPEVIVEEPSDDSGEGTGGPLVIDPHIDVDDILPVETEEPAFL